MRYEAVYAPGARPSQGDACGCGPEGGDSGLYVERRKLWPGERAAR